MQIRGDRGKAYSYLGDEVSNQDREDGASYRRPTRYDAIHSSSTTMPPVTDDTAEATQEVEAPFSSARNGNGKQSTGGVKIVTYARAGPKSTPAEAPSRIP
jgi:hypothetical protein